MDRKICIRLRVAREIVRIMVLALFRSLLIMQMNVGYDDVVIIVIIHKMRFLT